MAASPAPVIRALRDRDTLAYLQLRKTALALDRAGFAQAVDEQPARSASEIRTQLRHLTAAADQFLLGAFLPGLVGLAGFSMEQRRGRAPVGWVWGLYVLPRWRGQEVGGELLDGLIARAGQLPQLSQIRLQVVQGNRAALRLYASRGFQLCGLDRSSLQSSTCQLDQLQMALWPPYPRSSQTVTSVPAATSWADSGSTTRPSA